MVQCKYYKKTQIHTLAVVSSFRIPGSLRKIRSSSSVSWVNALSSSCCVGVVAALFIKQEYPKSKSQEQILAIFQPNIEGEEKLTSSLFEFSLQSQLYRESKYQ